MSIIITLCFIFVLIFFSVHFASKTSKKPQEVLPKNFIGACGICGCENVDVYETDFGQQCTHCDY